MASLQLTVMCRCARCRGPRRRGTSEGRGSDRAHVASHSQATSSPAAWFLDLGVLEGSLVPHALLACAAAGSQHPVKVTAVPLSPSPYEESKSSPDSMRSRDSSFTSMSDKFSLPWTRWLISCYFACFLHTSVAFFFFLSSMATFRAACRAVPSGPFTRCGWDR